MWWLSLSPQPLQTHLLLGPPSDQPLPCPAPGLLSKMMPLPVTALLPSHPSPHSSQTNPQLTPTTLLGAFGQQSPEVIYLSGAGPVKASFTQDPMTEQPQGRGLRPPVGYPSKQDSMALWLAGNWDLRDLLCVPRHLFPSWACLRQ
jgi:hypothetical protein